MVLLLLLLFVLLLLLLLLLLLCCCCCVVVAVLLLLWVWTPPDRPPQGRPPPDHQNFALFLPFLATVSLFLCLSGGLLVEFWWILEAGAVKCARLGSRAVVLLNPGGFGAEHLVRCCLEPGRKREKTAD